MKTALPLRSLTFGPDSDGAELFFEEVRTAAARGAHASVGIPT